MSRREIMINKTGKNPDLRILGAILAGGRSCRMGRDKASIKVFGPDGPTMLERAIKVAETLCRQYVVSTVRPYPPHTCVYDEATGHGPIYGVIKSLEYARENGFTHALILACDLPLMREDLLARLLMALDKASLGSFFINERTGIVEMLAGIYAVKALPFLRKGVEEKIYGLYAALPKSGLTLVPYGERDAAAFVNCNRVEDLEKLGLTQS